MASAGIGRSIEGIHSVAAALAAGRVRKLFVERKRSEREPLSGLVQKARDMHIPISVVADAREIATSTTPQGIVAECSAVPTLSIDVLAAVGHPALIALDHLQDPQNVGAIARSALAAGMTGMVISDVRAAPLQATAFKASVGALETLPLSVVASIPNALARLKKAGIWTIGLDADGDGSLFEQELLTEPCVVVVGAEGDGLSRLARQTCDVVVSIPMAAQTESLNASVSAALACFEVLRIRQANTPNESQRQ